MRGRPLWDRGDSPSAYVGEKFGVPHWVIRKVIHDIKASADLNPDDRVIIYPNGDVTDENDNDIGNIYDEI